MKDPTLIKLASLFCLTGLACVYFIFVQKDGAIFGVVSTGIGIISGYEIGQSAAK